MVYPALTMVPTKHTPTLPHPLPMDPFQEGRGIVRKYIEQTLINTIDELALPDGRPFITLRRRTPRASFFINPVNSALEATNDDSYLTYTWPGKNVYEAWKFTVALKVLAAIWGAICAGIVVSKRDIYYTDPICFGTQKVVDALVDDFAHTIGVSRTTLNVEAAAKGLVAGYHHPTSSFKNGSSKDFLIPRTQDIGDYRAIDVKWILIIEKEAVHRRLVERGYHIKSRAGMGILITGKGYPDLNTRAFVRTLFENSTRSQQVPPFFALVDCDPDGLAVMSTYKYGSMAYASRNARLNVPGIRWLGLRTSDAVPGADAQDDEGPIPLTTRDRRKAIAMLSNNPVWDVNGPELDWRAEIQQMLMLNLKAELETLYNRKGGLEQWIDRKMTSMV